MDQRLPEVIRRILKTYFSLVDEKIPGLIAAFYVVGSIALSGYNERFSDIDFVAVLEHPVTQTDLQSLRSIHRAVESAFPTSKLSGSYLQQSDLGRFEEEIQPHPYYQNGKLIEKGYFEINSITWWELKNHGIPICGPDPKELPFTVDWDLLIAQMKDNLNSYWKRWTISPRALLMLLSDWGIQWAVLGVLRQFYTFREHSIVTKSDAGTYALTCLPMEWHSLILDAIHIREQKTERSYRSRILRMMDTVRFLKYIIETVNKIDKDERLKS